MGEKKSSGSRIKEPSAVAKLAAFFPDATPVRIPVSVSRNTGGRPETEATVIEFGTPREALFACRLPLEFADKLQLRNADGSLETDAWVVALQYHKGQAAVAARFAAAELPNWVVKC